MLGAFAALSLCSPMSLLPLGLGLFPSHEGEERSSYRLEDPLALPPSKQGLFWLLAGGGVAQSWATPSQEPVGSIRPFWHSLPTRPAPQDASSREGPAGSMPAWPLLAVAWRLGVGVRVCMYWESLPLGTWVWVPSFELEGGSCDLALNHPGIRLQLNWDVSEGK